MAQPIFVYQLKDLAHRTRFYNRVITRKGLGVKAVTADNNLKYLETQINKLEGDVREIREELKHLERRVSGHDTTLGKIEVIVEGLSQKWTVLETKIDKALEDDSSAVGKSTDAWKEVTIEAIKTIALVAGAILAAKFFAGG